ncbi:MAG: hypothetical protein KJ558_16105 [Gammaproteobacteria bacterium]|nr:hypothetical protein [Gammaproteobacteria bacterium]MBU1656313.1 hypothetical protein [Gammaproteobacteria bacterium]MBU1959878.1 hypothetical protein [Gammaproteobacteria bacterium]
MYRFYPVFFFPLLLILLSGCDSMPLTPSHEKLRQTLRSYEVTLRWTSIADTYKFLTPELATDTPIPTGLENIKITDYEILSPATLNGDRAQQRVRIRYIFQDRQIVRELVDNQQWFDHPEQGWKRSNPIPRFQ